MSYILYNSITKNYICKAKNNIFTSTTQKNKAYIFLTYWAAKNVIDNGGLPKVLRDRDNYVPVAYDEKEEQKEVKDFQDKTSNKAKITKDDIVTYGGYQKLEKDIKENSRKLKTINTYLKNILSSTENYYQILKVLDKKVSLIYHYIESNQCITVEEKCKINDLLNRTLTLRRQVKKYMSINSHIKKAKLLEETKGLSQEPQSFKYWEFDMDKFITMIEDI